MTVPSADEDLLVPESYSNWNNRKRRKTGLDLRKKKRKKEKSEIVK